MTDWRCVGHTKEGPIWRDPWRGWIVEHLEEASRHEGRCVALHPELGVLAAGEDFESVLTSLHGRTGAELESVALMRMPALPRCGLCGARAPELHEVSSEGFRADACPTCAGGDDLALFGAWSERVRQAGAPPSKEHERAVRRAALGLDASAPPSAEHAARAAGDWREPTGDENR